MEERSRDHAADCPITHAAMKSVRHSRPMTVLCVVAIGLAMLAGAFFVGRDTAPESNANGGETRLSLGQTVLVPSIRLKCTLAVEAESRERFFCLRTGDSPTFQAVFERASTFIYSIEDPEQAKVFRERQP